MEFKNWLEDTEQKILYIMRGPPGSGKSFEVRKILELHGVPAEGHVFGTDEYLERGQGGYIAFVQKAIEGGYFDRMMCKFHKMNQERVVEAIKRGVNPIIVDNTNVGKKEMQPYVEAGVAYGYEIKFTEPTSEHWQRIAPLLRDKEANAERIKWAAMKLVDKNSHGVPFDAMMKFLRRWHVDPKIEDF